MCAAGARCVSACIPSPPNRIGNIICAFCMFVSRYRSMLSVVASVLLSHAHAVGSLMSRERAWKTGIVLWKLRSSVMVCCIGSS
eukprot:6077833-Prorocentrum_lima.AAC.1